VQQKTLYVDEKLKILSQPSAENLSMQVFGNIMKLKNGLKKHINGESAEFPFQKN